MPKPYYFLTFEQQQALFYDNNLSKVQPKELSGFFAFVAYEDNNNMLFILKSLLNYQTNHSGIAMILMVYQKKNLLNFFVEPKRDYSFSNYLRSPPKFGGEILLLESQIVFWNFKSSTYSLGNLKYHDGNPNLKQSIPSASLPPDRFITASSADYFANTDLPRYFKENGEFKEIEIAYATVLTISGTLKLPPLAKVQPQEAEPLSTRLVLSSS